MSRNYETGPDNEERTPSHAPRAQSGAKRAGVTGLPLPDGRWMDVAGNIRPAGARKKLSYRYAPTLEEMEVAQRNIRDVMLDDVKNR